MMFLAGCGLVDFLTWRSHGEAWEERVVSEAGRLHQKMGVERGRGLVLCDSKHGSYLEQQANVKSWQARMDLIQLKTKQ